MRSLVLLAALLLSGTGAADAQPRPSAGDSAARAARPLPGLSLGDWFQVPRVPADSGDLTIAAGDTVHGDVATRGGTLRVDGVVTGTAIAWDGDVVVGPGGAVLGDAVAVQGRVRLEGGRVDGEARAVRGDITAAPLAARETRPATRRDTSDHLQLVLGWFVVLSLIGAGVLVFAGDHLRTTVETLQGAFGRSFAVEILGQLALAPAILIAIVGLAITLLGILLIPFAIVAIVLAAAGLMTLGFLAAAQVTGEAFGGTRTRQLSARGAALRALAVGLLLYVAVWLAAALLTPWPTAAMIVRGIAVALTWAAVTAGFGAALLSRAGTRRVTPQAPPPTTPGLPSREEEEISWQTPTPIGGVAAARRPVESSSPPSS
jgi:hypothetical protein